MSGSMTSKSDWVLTYQDYSPEAEGLRELRVRFGRYGYAIQYSVEVDVVLITQIFHVREAR